MRGKGEEREEGKEGGRRRGKEGTDPWPCSIAGHELTGEDNSPASTGILGVSRRTRNEEFLRDSQRLAKKV